MWTVPGLVPGRTGGTVPVRPARSMSILSIALLIFIVLDPFGNMVTLNTLLGALPATRRRRVMFRESLIALGILLLFVFAGGILLRALGLDTYTLGISGGIVLFMIALGMVFPARRVVDEQALQMVLDGVAAYLSSRGTS